MMKFKNWVANLPHQYRTHQNADLSLEEYLKVYGNKFKNVRIGCSFAPDLVEQMYERENGHKSISEQQKLEVLKVLIHDFGIRDIRLGVKWNKSVNAKGTFDFSYYHPYLDYCLSNKVEVCLNVGPIKTFGWPEEHIPKHIIKSDPSLINSVVYSNSPVAVQALEHLDTLLRHIETSYTKDQLRYLEILQPENESFNSFGKLTLQLSQEYIYEVVKKSLDVFPNKKILLSSAETRDVSKIIAVIRRLLQQEKISPQHFITGINYYYNLPTFLKFSTLGPVDNITISNFLQRKTHYDNVNRSRKIGYSIEVTEAQFEQWGKAYLSPGNSFHEAKYLFARCVENILDPEKGGLIRLWGFERYAKRKRENTLIHDHKMNLELISRVNNK